VVTRKDLWWASSAHAHRTDPTRSVFTEFRSSAVDGLRILVANLEALNGTPILDVKPVLGPVAER